MNRFEIIHKRNILMTKLSIGIIFLSLIMDVVTGMNPKFFFSLGIGGGIICAILIALVLSKKFYYSTMYFAVFGNAVLTFILISLSPNIGMYLILYYCLAAAALYQNPSAIATAGVLDIVMSNYFYFALGEQLFPGATYERLITLNLILLFVTILLFVQSRFSQRILDKIEANQNEIVQGKSRIELILGEIRYAIQGLNNYSHQLKQNISISSTASKEITCTFADITKGIENQSSSINDISETMHSVNKGIESIASTAQLMTNISNITSSISNEGNEQINVLTREMQNVSLIINNTADLMNKLSKQALQVESIADTINAIAEQTNLLALNAAIEAARAGEHGKGFSVVADEVRKLAENARQSTKEISDILKDIQKQSMQVAEQVNIGLHAVESSKQVTQKVESVFKQINTNTNDVLLQATNVNQMIQTLHISSSNIVGDITSISYITEASTASVEEVLANIELHDNQLQDIEKSFEELESMTMTLESLAK